jgi:hypothetical protein
VKPRAMSVREEETIGPGSAVVPPPDGPEASGA